MKQKRWLSALIAALLVFVASIAFLIRPPGQVVGGDFPPQVMIEGEIYGLGYCTGDYSEETAGPEFWDGQITSVVPQHERPADNNQANFGEVGTGWRWGRVKGSVELLINREWYVYATAEAFEAVQEAYFRIPDAEQEGVPPKAGGGE